MCFRSSNPEDWLKGVPFPCGQCLPCRINKRRIWTGRLFLESLCYKDIYGSYRNSFFTLTYDDESMPVTLSGLPTLRKKHLQDFLKRLRKQLPFKIRYYIGAEYGPTTKRPHYHAVFFGLPPRYYPLVARCWSSDCSRVTSVVYQNIDKRTVDKLMTFENGIGNIYVGYDCGPKAMEYVAGYVTKKLLAVGSTADDAYSRKYYPDGREREFSLMSTKPSIGLPFVYLFFKEFEEYRFLNGSFQNFLEIGKRKYPFSRSILSHLRVFFPELDNPLASASRAKLLDESLRNCPDVLASLSPLSVADFGLVGAYLTKIDDCAVTRLEAKNKLYNRRDFS